MQAHNNLSWVAKCQYCPRCFRQMSWLFPQCFKNGLCTSHKMLFRCYKRAVYYCAYRQLSWQETVFCTVFLTRLGITEVLCHSYSMNKKKWIIPGTTSNCVNDFMCLCSTGSCDINRMIFLTKKSFDFNRDFNQWLKSALFKSVNPGFVINHPLSTFSIYYDP